MNKTIPERVEEIADAIDRTYEDERDRFDRGFRKQMTKNTLTTLLTETDQQTREAVYQKLWDFGKEHEWDNQVMTDIRNIAFTQDLSNPPSQV